jgi:hypothetical protein
MRQDNVHALPFLVRLRARYPYPDADRLEPEMCDVDADQLRAPECAGEANQKQRPAAQAGQIAWTDGDQLPGDRGHPPA